MSQNRQAPPQDIRLIVFDFDGVFTDNKVYVFEDGREAVRCTRADGLGLAKLRKRGIDMIILSSEENSVVRFRAKKLKLDCVQGVTDKLASLETLASDRGLQLGQVAFVGNDINDEACLRAVGLPITVDDAHPGVRDLGAYITRARGGDGAVREICDWFGGALDGNDAPEK